MDIALDIIFLLVGVGIAAVFFLWASRKNNDSFKREAEAATQSERSVLEAKLDEAHRRATDLSADVTDREEKLAEARRDMADEMKRRAAAEEAVKQVDKLERELESRNTELGKEREKVVELTREGARLSTALDKERKSAEEKLALVLDAEQKLSDHFKALSSDALEKSSKSFIQLAKTTLEKFHEGAKTDLEKRQNAIGELVKPVKQSLEKVDEKIGLLENARLSAYAQLKQQIVTMSDTQGKLRSETANLVNALRSPNVRGRWGEILLKRVVELAGMVDHCDFFEQESVMTEEGRLRPDLLVRLPAGKNIIVDAKTPLKACLEALEATSDEERQAGMKDHARHVREHLRRLGEKAYWRRFEPTPEFVVLFLPGENFFSAALEADPELIEGGPNSGVILASPTTLIALLRAVYFGWKQESLAENAKEISDLGRSLYERLRVMGSHMSRVGENLDRSVRAYNEAVGSLESRVLVTARKFEDLEAAPKGDEIKTIAQIEQTTRAIQAPELLPAPGEESLLGEPPD